MAVPSVEEIRARLDGIAYPGFRHSLIRFGLVHEIRTDAGTVTISLFPASARADVTAEVRRLIASALEELDGVRAVEVVTAGPPRGVAAGAAPGAETPQGIPGVDSVVAVSSCKGGVGKSTVAANLACALALRGLRVGLLDADVYGPSVPLMMGVEQRPQAAHGKVLPPERHGVRLMSMGFFLDDRSPVIWRGPMVMGLIRQFLRDVDWGDLDVLVVDMPPGTGDAALTLAQQVPLTGAVIVTTPQEVALADVERGVAMFRQVHVPVLGIVENMAGYECPECGEHEDLFGAGGGESLSRQFGVPLLEQIPLVPTIRESGDVGRPIVVGSPDHPVSRAFLHLAETVAARLPAAEAILPERS
jgi:ATP-binding protein involved in chromosome partitioning